VEIDIPGDVRVFIDEVVDSFVMWDLLIFMSKKLGEVETSARIAQLLGRTSQEVLKPTQKLEKLGIITFEKRLDGEQVCRLNKKGERFSALERFWAYNENQENRLRILSYLLQKKVR
jgi:Mn-dependent DtxR family transcriptional regulator